jgi:anti-sigma factor RsiW
MTFGTATTAPHPDDGALVRHLDGEGPPDEQKTVSAHLAECAACARRHRTLEAQAQALTHVLARTDPLPRPFDLRRERRAGRSRFFPWAAAAAVLLVVGAIALVVSPGRAWVLERWADVRRLVGAPRATPAPQAPPRVHADTVGIVSFTPTSDVLVVRVTARQGEGSLLLETTTAPAASASVSNGGDGEELIVLPGELRIANTAASRASYRVILPARLRRVVVLIGAEPPISIAPVPPGERRSLDLREEVRP